MFIKRIALILLVVVGLGFAFHQSILHFSLQYYISHTAERAGYSLVYQEVRASPHELVLIAPKVSLLQENSHFEADEIRFAYALHPLSGTLDLNITLNNPHINLHSGSLDLEKLLTSLFQSASWFKINGHIHNAQGTLTLGDLPMSLHFVVDQTWGLNPKAYYRISSDPALDHKGNVLEITYGEEGGTVHSTDIDTAVLTQLLHSLFPSSQSWVFEGGRLNGEINFELDDWNFTKGSGELYIEDLTLQHKDSKIKAVMGDILLKASPSEGTLASLEFLEGTVYFSDEETYGVLKDLKGVLQLTANQQLQLFADGILSSSKQKSYAWVQASTDIPTFKEGKLTLVLNHLDQNTPTLFDVTASLLNTPEPHIDLILKNVRQREFGFAQRVLDNTGPHLNPITYISGTISATLRLGLKNGMISSLAGKQINAEKLFFLIKPWELAIGSEKMTGEFSLDLSSPNPLDTLNASIGVENGQLALVGIHFDRWNFTNIQTELKIKQGSLQASSASVQLAGLKGEAEILGSKLDVPMRLKLHGKGSDIIPFVPERIQKGIQQSLNDDLVTLEAQVKKRPQGLAVEANALIKNNATNIVSPPIEFGFVIDRISLPHTAKFLADQEQFLKSLSPSLLNNLTPDRDLPLSYMIHSYLRQETGYSGYKLHQGWLKVNRLPLDKYVSPFIFPDKELMLSGFAEIVGEFDSTGISIRYQGTNLTLENEQLTIQVPEIVQDLEHPGAYHTLDLITMQHFGRFPIENGSYFDKGSGLLFSDMSGDVLFEGEKVHIDDVGAFCNGIFFEGIIDVDYSSPLKGQFDVNVHADSIVGSFSQAQNILAHFDKPYYITKIPLEGSLSFGPEGGDLFFGVKPDDVDFQARFDGCLMDGKLFSPHIDLAIHELSLNFLFDHQKNFLDLTDMQGMLLLGKPEAVEEYSIHSEGIRFSDFEKNIASFDIRIKEDSKDLFAIVGNTVSNPENPDSIDFQFDLKKSHFGEIYPQKLLLTLTDWNRVDDLQLEAHFRLSTLLHNLQKLGRSQNFLSGLINDLHQFSAVSGELALKLGFEGYKGTLSFDLGGDNILIDQHLVKTFHLSGYQREDKWSIEQLQLDNISIAAELQRKDALWKIDFMGLRYAEDLLLGLNGSYEQDKSLLSAHVNLLEMDLGKISEWQLLKSVFEDVKPEGVLKGSGEIQVKKPTKETGWNLDLLITAASTDLSINGYPFKDTEDLRFHLVNDRGWTLSNFNSEIAFDEGNGSLGFHINSLDYDFTSECLTMDSMPFSIDPSRLPWLANELSQRFPETFDDKIVETLTQLKADTPVKGKIDFSVGPSSDTFHLSLADDRYYLFGEERDLKFTVAELSENELKITSLFALNNHPTWISSLINPNQSDQGKIIIADGSAEKLDLPPLLVFWHSDPQKGLIIDKVSGHLSGIDVNLVENAQNPSTSETFNLVGSLDIDGTTARQILPPMLEKAFETLQMGRGYQMQGNFEIHKESPKNGDRDIRAYGTLTGNDLELKNYRFRQLSSQFIYNPASFQLIDFNIYDHAGSFHMDTLRVEKQKDDSWTLFAPMLTAYEVRPSLLNEVGKPDSHIRKPLVIQQFYLQNIVGKVGDANSFTGQGTFHFINPQKKNLQNTIFAIPAEILTRIGLNLSVLTPVAGTIHFELNQGKFVLTKFKDVYSDKKISKFYLSGPMSTIDLDGNLNIQVRFKQSTLLLKLAEMFTVNVKGTLTKPTYSLQRQKYLINQEVYTSQTEGQK